MMKREDHTIGKQSIEIAFTSLDEAFGVQDRIAEIYYERLQPGMEKLFDEMFDKDRIVVIDRIEVDCELLNNKNWEEEWVEATLRQLADQLRQADKRPGTIADTSNEFFYYLRHGYLPWNSRALSVAQLEGGLIIDYAIIDQLIRLIRRDKMVARRLVHCFSEAFVKAVIEKFMEGTEIQDPEKEEIVNNLLLEPKISKSQNERLLVALAEPMIAAEEFNIGFDKSRHLLANKEKFPVPAHDPKKHENEKGDEAIYINNAGLVILHPFFSQLFEHLELTKDDQWTGVQKDQQGVIIMHHLATGLNEFEEFDLVLEKIMCGMDPKEVITENISAGDGLHEACDELILAVIGHWSALKNTGVEAFREAFIQRRGKLSRVNNGWLLQVERKAVDVLLGSLPWGIGVIRLPWMREMVFVEW